MSVSAELIEEYFDQFGWTRSRDEEIEDGAAWITGFRGDVSAFRVYVRTTDDWVYFSISPFVVRPRPECLERVLFHLARLNDDVNLAKFCLDRDGDVALRVELPGEGFAYEMFADALSALCVYADQHYLEVLELSQRPWASSGYEDEWRERSGSEPPPDN